MRRPYIFFFLLLFAGLGCKNQSPTPPTAPESISWWQPTPELSWQWQLEGAIRTDHDVDVYDVDLFDTPTDVIQTLHAKNRKVVCYFSAGSFESWRPDAELFPPALRGRKLKGWEDEAWLDVRNLDTLLPIMASRLDLAVEKKCDGVEPDNVDGHQNETGFAITSEHQLAYNKRLAEEAHARGLAIGLKNDLDQIPDLVDFFDFAVNEQCFQYRECYLLLPFITQQKAVFGVEYELAPEKFCEEARRLNFRWLKMDYDLAGGRISCDDDSFN